MVIEWTLSIGYPQATKKGIVEIDPDDFEGMSKDEQEEMISELINEAAQQYISIDWTLK